MLLVTTVKDSTLTFLFVNRKGPRFFAFAKDLRDKIFKNKQLKISIIWSGETNSLLPISEVGTIGPSGVRAHERCACAGRRSGH